MVVPANVPGCHELRTADGQVFAVVMSPEEFERMKAEAQALRGEVETLTAERDRHAARVGEMIRDWVPGPMTPEQIAEAERNVGNLSAFIAKLERE